MLSDHQNPSDVWNALDKITEFMIINSSIGNWHHRASLYHSLGLNIYAHIDLVDALNEDISDEILLLNARVSLQMNDPEVSLQSLLKYFKCSNSRHEDMFWTMKTAVKTHELDSENPVLCSIMELEQYFIDLPPIFEAQLSDENKRTEFITIFLQRTTDRIQLQSILKRAAKEIRIRKEASLDLAEGCSTFLQTSLQFMTDSSEYLEAMEKILADIEYVAMSNSDDDFVLLKDIEECNSKGAEEFAKMSINIANHYSALKLEQYNEDNVKRLVESFKKFKTKLEFESKRIKGLESTVNTILGSMNETNKATENISYLNERLANTLDLMKLAKPMVERIVTESSSDSDAPLSLLSESIRKYIDKYDTYYEICDKDDLIVSRLRRHYRSGPSGQRSYENIMHVLKTINSSHEETEAEYNIDKRVRVVEAPGKGMALLSEIDFSPQDVVFIEDAIVSFCDDMGYRCSHCHRPLPIKEEGEDEDGERLVKTIVECSDCGEVFCSDKCMETANREYHSLLCGTEYRETQKAITQMHPTSSSLNKYCLMIKLIAMSIIQELKSPLDLPCMQVLKRLTDLEVPPTSPQDLLTSPKSVGIYKEIDKLFREDFDIFYDENPRLRAEELVQMDSCLTVNSMILGSGVHALMLYGSFINHSCEPNLGYQSTLSNKSERVGVFQAKRAIAAGEELTISYIDHEMPYLFRAMALKRQYGFECSCRKCVREQKFDIIIPD